MLPELMRAYSEPHRHYHTLSHINYMFKKANEWDWLLTDDLIYAIWFHDVCYNVSSKTNEQDSCSALGKAIMGIGDILYQNVSRAIMNTISHVCTADDELSKQLIDLDLAILGEDEDEEAATLHEFFDLPAFPMFFFPLHYGEYVTRVRAEWSHLSDVEWFKGRSTWIEEFMKRDKIFYTKEGQLLEIQARKNLSEEKAFYDRWLKVKENGGQ